MKTLARTVSLAALLLLCLSRVTAQGIQVESKTPPPIQPQTFTSLEGRFTIALPQQVSGVRGVTTETPKGRITLGDAYSWRLPDSQYEVSYIDTTLAPDFSGDGKALVNNVAEAVIGNAAKRNGKLLGNTEISLAGNYGREIKIELADSVLISRIYFAHQRMYQAAVGVKKDQKLQEEAAKILDTFKVLSSADVEAVRQKQIAEATPGPLPQEPAARKLKSDADDEGLKGRVKLVVTEDEDIPDTGAAPKRKPTSTEYFNEQGNLTKRLSYDYKGNLDEIAVYGYLDGERASRDKFIQQEYDPPPMLVASAPDEAKPKYDTRYHYKYKYKYDDKGRLVEETMYGNSGKMWMRYVYNYKGDQKETLAYDEQGKLNQKHTSTLDAQGNEVEESYFDIGKNAVDERYSYSYEFDAQGNWIKRTTSKWTTKDGKSQFVPDSITYRTITYY